MIQGLTQWGFTGTTLPLGAIVPEFEGLNASAVAVAVTVFVFLAHIRENIVGSPCRLI